MAEQGLEKPVVIKSNDLGVCFRRYRYQAFTLKEVLVRSFRTSAYDHFWAIRHLDLEVKKGESLGIIGPNGAGKSTLLKALTRVLPPAEGSFWTKGKIAPLIEVGGGFNAELTARENVFFHGAIMGFSKKEMEEKLPRIIEFAELEDFVDVPLHSFSTGMKSRFAFSCATDVNPDILILDEVFSVGDERFREKSMERMKTFFEEQRTIVLVSHSLNMVQNFCDRTIWLDKGKLIMDGESKEVVGAYKKSVSKK